MPYSCCVKHRFKKLDFNLDLKFFIDIVVSLEEKEKGANSCTLASYTPTSLSIFCI